MMNGIRTFGVTIAASFKEVALGTAIATKQRNKTSGVKKLCLRIWPRWCLKCHKARTAQKIEKIESKINWNENAEEILAKIRAFYPIPGTWFVLNGKRIKITKT